MTEVERIVKIIMPGLLDYLKMVESGEIIGKRLEKNFPSKEEDRKNEK